MLREARGGIKATVGNIVTTRVSSYPPVFFLFFFLFFFSPRVLFSPVGYAQTHASTYWTSWALARLRFEEHIYICLTVTATLS